MITAATAPELFTSRHLPSWLAEQRISFAFTAMDVGKLFLIGSNGGARVTVQERSFARCQAVGAHGEELLLGSAYLVWRLHNVLPGPNAHAQFDRLYAPRMAWVTGDLDIHDIARDHDGRVIVASTMFSCIAALGDSHSFHPLWHPPFISRLAPEDRCHLNGFAMRDGRITHVTTFATSDVADGWREHRLTQGSLLDVPDGEVVLGGLCMPHSPRWHNGKLWLLEAGRGRFGYVDMERGVFEPVAFCPGLARGLAFYDNFAIIGLSKPRDEQTFTDLPLERELERRGAQPRCGLMVVDVRTGDTAHWLRIEGVVNEIHGVAALGGTARPGLVGVIGDEVNRLISIGPSARLHD